MPWRTAAVLAAAFALAGCLGIENRDELPAAAPLPPTIPQAAAPRPADSPADREVVARFGGAYRAPAAEAMVKDVVDRLVAASGGARDRYSVVILNSATVNAFALPSGRIYVTRGLLALANDTSELAAVLAHEIAHVTARHAVARADLQRKDELVSRVSEEVLNDPASAESLRSAARRTLASFSRQQELEADQIGVRNVAAAGFDPFGAARFLVSLGRIGMFRAGAQEPGNKQDLFASHPTTPERLARVLLTARQIGAPGLGARDRERYLRSIDGIAYGDNPADGVVRGRRFLHPRLRVVFTAPEGFQLENGTDTVIGATASADQALRFDAVKLPDGQALEDYLRSGLLQEGTLADIETLAVSGRPGATGIARGSDWTYRVGVVRVDGQVYRFIFAAKRWTPDVDRAFRQTLAGFRTLEVDEVERARQTRLEIVIARAGDTTESLAARMQGVVDRPVDRFNLLNGLENGAGVVAGEPYKLVME